MTVSINSTSAVDRTPTVPGLAAGGVPANPSCASPAVEAPLYPSSWPTLDSGEDDYRPSVVFEIDHPAEAVSILLKHRCNIVKHATGFYAISKDGSTIVRGSCFDTALLGFDRRCHLEQVGRRWRAEGLEGGRVVWGDKASLAVEALYWARNRRPCPLTPVPPRLQRARAANNQGSEAAE